MSTKETYNKFAQDYHSKRRNPENNLWNEHLDFPMIESLLGKSIKGKLLVDLGCGSGLFSRRFAESGAKTLGVDRSEKLIRIAEKENPSIEFKVADVCRTSLPDNHFDLAVSCLVMHYFKDLKSFFDEAHRILGPRGEFIFSFHHPFDEVLDEHKKASPYFHQDSYRWTLLDGMELESFHHTFEDVTESLFSTGFIITGLKEARPAKSFEKTNPDFYLKTSRYPSFAAIRAQKFSER